MTQHHLALGTGGDAGFTGYFRSGVVSGDADHSHDDTPNASSAGRARRPALIVLQEIYGVNDEVRRVVDAYAAVGFNVLAPDLLWRVKPGLVFDYAERDAAREAIGRLDTAQIALDIEQSARVLAQHGAGSDRIGILAFGWGGQHALSAARNQGFHAVASYYPGSLAPHIDTAAQIEAPLLFHLSTVDFRTPLELRGDLRRALAQRDDVEIYSYGDVDHGFANQARPEYARAAATLADARTVDFLKRHLERSV
ncbi:dienelactone hydrolase family protein [Pararobbsia silviterrae]|uniref:Dienelactone hydrolase family protein n=1 Tax=Pararobbsia silviterrae TaxID=1792498 RepID=A0A494XVQ1_9BURK|nr:dienelactone hydrolase family protein [Pararobbsia silviterrae]RKP53763.1 dienelactone hydrolase family protein [Pararobbsia silviterrae]